MFWTRIKTVDGLVKKYKSTDRILSWIRWNIFPTRAVFGGFPTPEQVLKDKKAWCKGYAVLSYAVLTKLGYDPKLVSFMWREKGELVGHVVCAWKDDGWHYSDNGILHHCSVVQESLKDVAIFACPGKVYAAYERDGRGNLVNILISGV